ncbi:MAG: LysR family transcriptional regulator [Chloroflexota bacterium]
MDELLDPRLLRTFRTVARTLSFTRAAEELGYAQSSVTMQIQALEKATGVQLFDRLGRRIALTQSGRQLLSYADRIVQLAEEAFVAVANAVEPSGRLTISTPQTVATYRLPPVFRHYRRLYPNVQFIIHTIPDDRLVEKLGNGSIDVAVTLSEPQTTSHELVTENLIPEELLLLASPDHPLTSQRVVRLAHLEPETFLLTESGCPYRNCLERLLAENGLRLRLPMEFSSIEAIKQCVIAGMGITLLPRVAVQRELQEGQLVPLNWEHTIQISTQLVYHRDKWIFPALEKFLELCRQMIPQSENGNGHLDHMRLPATDQFY